MARALQLSLLAVLLAVPANGQGTCSSPNDGHGGHIVDITATIRASLPTWLSETGLGEGHRTETWSMLNGDDANASELTFSAHTGTHVDAPRHFVPWKNQQGMETVDIGAMNGPALLIEAYDVPVLNREALEALDIPHAGVSRLIIRTDNTRRKLMHTTAFTPDYVAFDTEGAKWLVEHRPDIRAIGIDYLSIAALDHLAEAHVALLDHGIVPIEGLVLDEDNIDVGWWWLHCAPLKVEGSDGAPARAWLTPVNDPAGAKKPPRKCGQ